MWLTASPLARAAGEPLEIRDTRLFREASSPLDRSDFKIGVDSNVMSPISFLLDVKELRMSSAMVAGVCQTPWKTLRRGSKLARPSLPSGPYKKRAIQA